MARAETTNVIVRFPPETHAAVCAAAKRLGLSLNSWIVVVTGGAASDSPPLPAPNPDRVEKAPRRAAAGVNTARKNGCEHPKESRQSLGYMTRCGKCGARL